MLVSNHLIGFAAGGSSATAVFTDSSVDTTNTQATYTFASQAFGTAAAGRIIVVGVSGWANNFAVSSVTIADTSATLLKAEKNGNDTVEMWAAVVPTGTTGTVTVVFAGAEDACGIGVWAVYGANSTVSATAGSQSTDPASASLTVPSGGVAIGYTGIRSDTNRTFTWSGLTEEFDEVVESATSTHTGASGSAGGTITCAPSGAGVRNPIMILAAYAPA